MKRTFDLPKPLVEVEHGKQKYPLDGLKPDGLKSITGPVQRLLVRTYFPNAITVPTFREGHGFEARAVDRFFVIAIWAVKTEEAFMNIIEQLKGNYDEAAALWVTYKDRLDAFRSAVKNDVTSLEAAARKATEATNKMKTAYSGVLDLLNSNEMRTAVENAERLAAAMSALANLQTHRLVLSVTEQDRP